MDYRTKIIKLCFVIAGLTASSVNACGWEPQPWRKYLIKTEVEKDTIPQHSIMRIIPDREPKIDKRHFQCGPYYVYQPGIFEAEDEQRERMKVMRGEYSTADFISDLITDVIDIFTTK